MSPQSFPLSFLLAISAVVHVLVGPDHYLPIAAASYDFGWSRSRTLIYTLMFGVIHCLTAVIVAAAAIHLKGLLPFETQRAFAAKVWLIAASVWALWAWRRKAGELRAEAAGRPLSERFARPVMMWLAIFFIIGPCEPLTALWMAARESAMGMASLAVHTAVFVAATIGMMVMIVDAVVFGWSRRFVLRLRPSWPVLPLSWVLCAGLLVLGV